MSCSSLNPGTSVVRRLIDRTFAKPECSSLIESLFSSKDGRNAIQGLQRDDAQSFVDILDEVRPTSACRSRTIEAYACIN